MKRTGSGIGYQGPGDAMDVAGAVRNERRLFDRYGDRKR
jgi:hypothetical protein